ANYVACKVTAFRSVKDNDNTVVDAVCRYKNEPTPANFDRVRVYQELSDKTERVTKLGIYKLEKNSLYVNGYRPSSPSKPTPTSNSPVAAFQLGFRIINENLNNPNPSSPEYQALLKTISEKVNRVYNQSNLRGDFRYCQVTGLRLGSILVDCNCFFKPASNLGKDDVERTFQAVTGNATGQWLGNRFQIQELAVNGESAQPLGVEYGVCVGTSKIHSKWQRPNMFGFGLRRNLDTPFLLMPKIS
uniref:SEA domain-containing protein n=1 Tax=Sphenodon punctatus TaxID=8508 RepID=A0A8D0L826_SPHPU